MLCNFIEITFRHGCSPVNLLHIFRTPFPKTTPGGPLASVMSSLPHKAAQPPKCMDGNPNKGKKEGKSTAILNIKQSRL